MTTTEEIYCDENLHETNRRWIEFATVVQAFKIYSAMIKFRKIINANYQQCKWVSVKWINYIKCINKQSKIKQDMWENND